MATGYDMARYQVYTFPSPAVYNILVSAISFEGVATIPPFPVTVLGEQQVEPSPLQVHPPSPSLPFPDPSLPPSLSSCAGVCTTHWSLESGVWASQFSEGALGRGV